MKEKKGRKRLSTTRIIMFSFLFTILVGSVLLSLPIAHANRQAVPYVDALFTATTATCVTGLVTVPTYATWSLFGQIVILVLIQVGGLGIITVTAGLIYLLRRRASLSDRLLIQDAFNLNTLDGQNAFVRNVLLGTLIVEGLGVLLYMTVFVPEMGARGVWVSVFNSVSAFCNAGIDIIGDSSLMDYATNPAVNAITAFLIIFGGIGYVVWWEVLDALRRSIKQGSIKEFRRMSLHTKIALTSTAILLTGGFLTVLLFEFDNPLTIGELGLFDKLQVSFFQSVTLRTAGFATMDQAGLTPGTTIISLILMFIGGSPVGTAGGVKTVTVAVLMASAYNTVRNRDEVSLFHRRIEKDALRKAIAVVCMSFAITAVSALLLAATQDASLDAILFEAVSGTATVGLSRNLTPSLNTAGKCIMICTMYLGRIGPISLAFAFTQKRANLNIITNPIESVNVG
jgi:trk system potassium uptake protein TrkH